MNIEHAEQATTAICANVESALAALQRDRTVNGYGVFSAPWCEKTALRNAFEAISAALQTHAATSWPTLSDYTETNA
ncbi:hypothetical protein ACFCQI_14190 [Rhodanobacter sp. FW102-FHT14D06]|uniref:Uncharacterized protein n=2 Tax=unclassified Rhodanobacter TaxID=2621553 RepID=A0AB74UV56_9GAMM